MAEGLKDKALQDYAHTNEAIALGKQKYEEIKYRKDAFNQLAYHGEIFALEIAYSLNPNQDIYTAYQYAILGKNPVTADWLFLLGRFHLDKMPDEIIILIASHLPVRDRIKLDGLCKKFHRLIGRAAHQEYNTLALIKHINGDGSISYVQFGRRNGISVWEQPKSKDIKLRRGDLIWDENHWYGSNNNVYRAIKIQDGHGCCIYIWDGIRRIQLTQRKMYLSIPSQFIISEDGFAPDYWFEALNFIRSGIYAIMRYKFSEDICKRAVKYHRKQGDHYTSSHVVIHDRRYQVLTTNKYTLTQIKTMNPSNMLWYLMIDKKYPGIHLV